MAPSATIHTPKPAHYATLTLTMSTPISTNNGVAMNARVNEIPGASCVVSTCDRVRKFVVTW